MASALYEANVVKAEGKNKFLSEIPPHSFSKPNLLKRRGLPLGFSQRGFLKKAPANFFPFYPSRSIRHASATISWGTFPMEARKWGISWAYTFCMRVGKPWRVE